MDITKKASRYFRTFLHVAGGAGVVIAGAYIYSRIKEKQESEIRLARIEQMLAKFSEETENKG